MKIRPAGRTPKTREYVVMASSKKTAIKIALRKDAPRDYRAIKVVADWTGNIFHVMIT